jgi:hypothetical protein
MPSTDATLTAADLLAVLTALGARGDSFVTAELTAGHITVQALAPDYKDAAFAQGALWLTPDSTGDTMLFGPPQIGSARQSPLTLTHFCTQLQSVAPTTRVLVTDSTWPIQGRPDHFWGITRARVALSVAQPGDVRHRVVRPGPIANTIVLETLQV